MKTIGLSEEAYNALYEIKGKKSFSDVAILLVNEIKKRNAEESFKNLEKLKGKCNYSKENLKEVEKGWKNWSKKFV